MFPNSIRLLLAIFAAIFVAAGTARAVPAADGLYATFRTTHGTYTIELEFEKVPMTVANFVGLAEGSRAWVDFKTGKASNKPFYNGLKIPRAEPGFVIQMGSPTNTTSGGPGYEFGDEIHPDLIHDRAGIASMANSVADTNGSQIFITLNPDPNHAAGLNRKHAVFGFVVEGLGVVQAIGLLPGGTVTIESVTITRVGAAAQAFDETAWGLPVVSQTPIEFDVSNAPAAFSLNYTSKPFTEFFTFDSANFKDWGLSRISFVDDLLSDVLDVTGRASGEARHFFRMAEAAYVPVPASLNGSDVEFSLISSNPDEILTLTFTADPRGGTADFDNPLGTFVLITPGSQDTTGKIGAYTWTQELHRGRLGVILEGLNFNATSGFHLPFYFNQTFRADGAGSFTGYAEDNDPRTKLINGPFPFYGPFTSAPTVP